MAEWFMEGLLERLLDNNDPLARLLLSKSRFYLVPNMNPDGSRRGHLRTNAAGTNLNRAWAEPDMDTSPEVYVIRQRMEQTGVDFCLDVHGDEERPYNYVITPGGIPSLTDRQRELCTAYGAALALASPDFRASSGYPVSAPGKADLRICNAWVAERFGCPALTFEQPFKDVEDKPDPVHGWSPERARILGRANLDALRAIVDRL